RAWELAGEELGEERMAAQLGGLEHRLAAAVRRAEEEIPLLAGARREQRVGFGDQRAIESLIRPCAPPDGLAEALPELRLQRPQRIAAAPFADVDAIAGARAIEHVLRRIGQLAEVRQEQPGDPLRHRHVDHAAAASLRALEERRQE